MTLTRPWSSREVAMLASNNDLGAMAVAEMLERTVDSVKCQAWRFGISLRTRPPLCPACGLRPVRTSSVSGQCRTCTLRRNTELYKAETARLVAAQAGGDSRLRPCPRARWPQLRCGRNYLFPGKAKTRSAFRATSSRGQRSAPVRRNPLAGRPGDAEGPLSAWTAGPRSCGGCSPAEACVAARRRAAHVAGAAQVSDAKPHHHGRPS